MNFASFLPFRNALALGDVSFVISRFVGAGCEIRIDVLTRHFEFCDSRCTFYFDVDIKFVILYTANLDTVEIAGILKFKKLVKIE